MIIKLDITPKIYENMTKIENHYKNFWKKIFKSDSYVYYKNAILFYKNIQHNKFHSFYSEIINMRLYTGKCIAVNKNMLNTFNNNGITTSDDLCNLTILTINLLDSLFEIAPRLNANTVVYRNIYNIDKNNRLANLKVGDYYRALELNSTSLSPFLNTPIDLIYNNEISKLKSKKNNYDIYITILAPKGSKAIYIDIPFVFDGEPSNEFEILLPRDCVYYVKNRKIIGSIILYTFQIVEQLSSYNREIIEKVEYIIPSTNIDKSKRKELNKLIKININYDKILMNYKTNFYNNLLKNYEIIKDNEINTKKIYKYRGKIVGMCFDNIDINIIQKKKLNSYIDLQKYYIIFYEKKIEYGDAYFLRGFFSYIKDKNLGYDVINTDMPNIILFDINIKTPIEINKTENLNIKIIKNIKVKIVNIKKVNIINKFYYSIIKCEQ